MSVIKSAVMSVGANVGTLVSPTFTVAADSVGQNLDRGIVTTLGGTQTGGRTHSISDPFAVTWKSPLTPRIVGVPDSQGILRPQPKNTYEGQVIKGMIPLAGQSAQIGQLKITSHIPAGAERADPVAVEQMFAAAMAMLVTWKSDILLSYQTGSK